MARQGLAATGLVVLLIARAFGGVIDPSLAEQLKKSKGDEKIPVILVLSDAVNNSVLNQELKGRGVTLAQRHYEVITTLQDKANKTQGPILSLLQQLESQGKAERVRSFWIANMIAFKGTPEAIRQAVGLAGVSSIVPDVPVESIKPIRGGSSLPIIAGHTNGLEAIHAPEVWAMGYTGAGRLVSNIDSGVDGSHPALSSRWRGNYGHPAGECWFDPVFNAPTPIDYWEHGTHTMGTICGRSEDTFDTIGVAIDAQWIAAGTVDVGTEADIVASFQWIADPDGDPSTMDDVPDAVGNSWGISPIYHGVARCDSMFWSVIDGCENAGIVVIFSAGNEGSRGPNSLRTPADRATTFYNSFAVGAVNAHSEGYPIAGFSSLGPCSCASGDMAIKPECVAPGVDVYSSVPGGTYEGDWSGTSMASPHVTGSVAVLRQLNPNLDVDAIKEILLRSAMDLGPTGEDNTYGRGIINLLAAAQLALNGMGSVDGFVTDIDSGNPLRARVEIMRGTNSTRADELGHYLISSIAETTYTLQASAFAYLPVEHDVYLAANDTASQDFQLTLAPAAVLQGTVTTVAGLPVGGVQVVIPGTPVIPDTTDGAGFYRFPDIPTDAWYKLFATRTGYSREIDSIYVQQGMTNVLDFHVTPAETFDLTDGGFIGQEGWQWGMPTAGPPEAHSGAKVWGTFLNGYYPDNYYSWMTSPRYALSGSDCRLEFYHWIDAEYGYDGGNVSISTDDGASWTVITPQASYNVSGLLRLDWEPCYTGTYDWRLAVFDLSSYEGNTVRFRWKFASDYMIVAYGWYIDDVVVVGGTTPPPPPQMSYSPLSFDVAANAGSVVTQNINLGNSGTGSLFYGLTADPSSALSIKVSDVSGNKSAADSISRKASWSDISVTRKFQGSGDPPHPLRHGGPDAYGYTWIDSDEPDGPPFHFVEFSGTHVEINEPIPIGFDFPFYGVTYDILYAHTNGFISFQSLPPLQVFELLPYWEIPNLHTPNDLVAAWWNFFFEGAGEMSVFRGPSQSYCAVTWRGMQNHTWPFDGTGSMTFQVILYPSGQIDFNYGLMDPGIEPLTGLIGLEDIDAKSGLQIVGLTPFMHDNLSIRITPSWLISAPAQFGIVGSNMNAIASIVLDTRYLSNGTFNGILNLDSNDPVTPHAEIPIVLHVSGDTARIGISQLSISDTVNFDGSIPTQILITNYGTSNLTFHSWDNRAWITASPAIGSIGGMLSDTLTVTLSGSSLPGGSYTGYVHISSNDPVNPLITLTVSMRVVGELCRYITGDVNGSGVFNGIDVTYGVQYFKGGPAPLNPCDCPPGNPWFPAGDVNGNCAFNGIDITYMISYFKAGPAPIVCPDCPPMSPSNFEPPERSIDAPALQLKAVGAAARTE